MREVDELDLNILKILEEDGRASFADIAKKIKSKESTVRKRALALQERGVIRKFSVSIEPSRIGLNTGNSWNRCGAPNAFESGAEDV